MGAIFVKKLCLIILIVSSALLVPTSLAGRYSRFAIRSSSSLGASEMYEEQQEKRARARVQKRLLRMNTNDYAVYDPAPALSNPRFKLIPN